MGIKFDDVIYENKINGGAWIRCPYNQDDDVLLIVFVELEKAVKSLNNSPEKICIIRDGGVVTSKHIFH